MKKNKISPLTALLLTMTAKAVRKWPKERWNFAKWVGDNWAGDKELSCGTTACAIGIATTIPEFQRLGLHLIKSENVYDPIPKIMFHGFENCYAIGEFYGITVDDAYFLFIPDWSEDCLPKTATKEQVARRIERFVRERT